MREVSQSSRQHRSAVDEEIAADVANKPAPDLYDLALTTLREAKQIIVFRRARTAIEEWAELSRQIPCHLVDALDEHEAASRERSLARHEFEQAHKIDPANPRRAGILERLERRVETAHARFDKAIRTFSDTQQERSDAQDAVAAGFLRKHKAAFHDAHQSFATSMEHHRRALERLNTAEYELGQWQGTCACEVLKQIADVLAEVLAVDPAKGDWMRAYYPSKRFECLDWAAWRALERAV